MPKHRVLPLSSFAKASDMKNAIMQLCIGVAIPTDSGNSLILNAKGAVQIQSGPPRPIGNYEIFIANLYEIF